MTGADKVVCQAATLLLLFMMTTMPAGAQLAGPGGASGGDDERPSTACNGASGFYFGCDECGDSRGESKRHDLGNQFRSG